MSRPDKVLTVSAKWYFTPSGRNSQLSGGAKQPVDFMQGMAAGDPRVQGKGCGATLPGESLRMGEAACELAYPEATNPDNIRFHLRHGFAVIGEIQIGGSPVVTRMLRARA